MARNIVPLGGELQVNLLDPLPRPGAPNGLLGDQFHAEATALPNGNFAVVYTNNAGGQGDLDILGVELTAAGTVVSGSTFRVDFDAGNQETADVAPRIGGGYVAVWKDSGNDGNNDNFISLAVIAPGTPSNPGPVEFKVEDTTPATFLQPVVATFSNGNYIVAYTLDYTSASDDDIRVAIVKADGTGYVTGGGVPKSVSAPNDLYWHDSSGAAVATSDNTALVVYRDQLVNNGSGASVGEADIRLAVVNAAGTVTDAEIVSDVANFLGTPDVAALTDGRFVIVWADTTTDNLAGRIYDPSTGTFSGAEFVVSSGASYQITPNVAALPDGGFIVTWTDNSKTLGDASEQAIHGRRFDATGAFAGDEFLVNTATDDSQYSSALAVNATGTIFVGWTDNAAINSFSTDADAGRIQGQFFNPSTEVINGTSAGDTIATYGLAEAINGLAGNDTIDSRGGDDVVSGGEGKDRLTGGAGGDGFLFDVKLKGKNVDHVVDFTPGVDAIILDKTIFKGLKTGELTKKAFFAGKKADEAKDGKDRIVYDTKSGDVWFDKDGKGGSKAKLVATLDGSPDLSHSDILVIA